MVKPRQPVKLTCCHVPCAEEVLDLKILIQPCSFSYGFVEIGNLATRVRRRCSSFTHRNNAPTAPLRSVSKRVSVILIHWVDICVCSVDVIWCSNVLKPEGRNNKNGRRPTQFGSFVCSITWEITVRVIQYTRENILHFYLVQ